jgi:hypothetical protein
MPPLLTLRPWLPLPVPQGRESLLSYGSGVPGSYLAFELLIHKVSRGPALLSLQPRGRNGPAVPISASLGRMPTWHGSCPAVLGVRRSQGLATWFSLGCLQLPFSGQKDLPLPRWDKGHVTPGQQ